MAVSWRWCACGAQTVKTGQLLCTLALPPRWPPAPRCTMAGLTSGRRVCGRGHRAKHPGARSWTLPRKPGSERNLSPGTPSPSPGKAVGERPVPAAPVPGRPLCGRGQSWPQPRHSTQIHQGFESRACVSPAGLLPFFGWSTAFQVPESHLMEVSHLLDGDSRAPHQLSASSASACSLTGWLLALGKGMWGRWGHPFLLARTTGMSVNLFIAGVTVLSALPDSGGGSDAF